LAYLDLRSCGLVISNTKLGELKLLAGCLTIKTEEELTVPVKEPVVDRIDNLIVDEEIDVRELLVLLH
jgi:hypothetical protein